MMIGDFASYFMVGWRHEQSCVQNAVLVDDWRNSTSMIFTLWFIKVKVDNFNDILAASIILNWHMEINGFYGWVFQMKTMATDTDITNAIFP